METLQDILMKIFKIFDDSLKDNVTGLYSHARIIAMLVAIAATIFMWKLIIMGGMSLDYFIAYLAYGTGAQTLNKFLDTRDPQRTAMQPVNNTQPSTPAPAMAPAAPLPKPVTKLPDTFIDSDIPKAPK